MKRSINKKVLIVGIAVGLIMSVAPCKAEWVFWEEGSSVGQEATPEGQGLGTSNEVSWYRDTYIQSYYDWGLNGAYIEADGFSSEAGVDGMSRYGGGGSAYAYARAEAWVDARWKWDGPPGESPSISCSFSVDLDGTVEVYGYADTTGDASASCESDTLCRGDGDANYSQKAMGYGNAWCSVSDWSMGWIGTEVEGEDGEIGEPDENDYSIGWAHGYYLFWVDEDENYVTSPGLSTFSAQVTVYNGSYVEGSVSSEWGYGHRAYMSAHAECSAYGISSVSLSF